MALGSFGVKTGTAEMSDGPHSEDGGPSPPPAHEPDHHNIEKHHAEEMKEKGNHFFKGIHTSDHNHTRQGID
jgi:hypothetical protein